MGTQHVALVEDWCADLASSVEEVRKAPAAAPKDERKSPSAARGVSAYDAVSGEAGGERKQPFSAGF